MYGRCRVHFFRPPFSQTASRSCRTEGGWSKSLNRLLLNIEIGSLVLSGAFCLGCSWLSQPLLAAGRYQIIADSRYGIGDR
jgi:hypothetical protein